MKDRIHRKIGKVGQTDHDPVETKRQGKEEGADTPGSISTIWFIRVMNSVVRV